MTLVSQRHSTGKPSEDQECRPRFMTEADSTQGGVLTAKTAGLEQGQALGTPGWQCRPNYVWGSKPADQTLCSTGSNGSSVFAC